LIWAAAARFVSRQVGERVWVDEGTFLLMVVHRTIGEGTSAMCSEPCASFFEAHFDDSGGRAMLVSPADEAASFNLDAPLNHGASTFEKLSMQLMPLSKAPLAEGQSSNPEEDVPLNAHGCATVLNDGRVLLRHGSDDKLDEPRSAPPMPHPGPVVEVSPEQGARKTLMLSPHVQNSPERVGLSSPWHPVEQIGSACAQIPCHFEQPSPEPVCREIYRVPSSTNEEVRLSGNRTRDLPQVLHSALGLNTAPAGCSIVNKRFGSSFKAVAQPLQAGGTVPWEAANAQEESEFLHQLVGMQQTQMIELQRQISDLHSLVAGMASRQSFDLTRTSQVRDAPNIESQCGVGAAPIPATLNPARPSTKVTRQRWPGDGMQMR